MDRREKQQKFHQAIIDMLYPPPSPSQSQQQEEEEEDPTTITSLFDVNLIKDPENYDGPSSSSDDEDEEGGPGSHKLTRAQRKRLRKTKLKESASSAPQRRKIIGPELNSAVNNPDGDGGSVGEDRPEGVRQNVPDDQSQNTCPDSDDCNAQKEGKLKRRRMAKKLAREKMRPSVDVCDDEDGDSAKE